MIDWAIVNKGDPQAVAFAIDTFGQAWLFGDVPVFVANRWCVGQGVWKKALGLINPVPSNAAGSLMLREDKQPAGWQPEGPTPPPQLKPGERAPQTEPVHAKGWATSGPAPTGMSMISDEMASGAQKSLTTTVSAGIVMNQRVTIPTPVIVKPESKQLQAATTFILTKVLLDIVEGLPEGKRREQLLELLTPPV